MTENNERANDIIDNKFHPLLLLLLLLINYNVSSGIDSKILSTISPTSPKYVITAFFSN